MGRSALVLNTPWGNIYKNSKGIYLFAVQKDKCQEKVWQKGVEFEEGTKDLSSKGLFPHLKHRPLLGTEL